MIVWTASQTLATVCDALYSLGKRLDLWFRVALDLGLRVAYGYTCTVKFPTWRTEHPLFPLHLRPLPPSRSSLAAMPPDDRLDSESDFKPNLVNSCCYLVEQTVQLTTFAVNYVGEY